MRLPIDFSHTPVDMDEAKEMLRRAERELLAKTAEAERLREDSERLAYLTADHDDAEVRRKRNELLSRMPVMSHSAACASIDVGRAALAATRKEDRDG